MPALNDRTDTGLRPGPSMMRRLSQGGPPDQAYGQTTSPAESESSDVDVFCNAPSPPLAESEDGDAELSSDQFSSDEPEKSEKSESDSTPSRDELTEEILAYLTQSTIDEVYGDSLSNSRTRRYEPKWPMEFEESEPPLHEPASQGDANKHFKKTFAPLRRWYKVSRGASMNQKALRKRQKIFSVLNAHRQSRDSKPPPEQDSGNYLLYHNFPDAAVELRVWSALNSARIAIRAQSWELADRRVCDAIRLANKLDYAPLVAKCWYWRGLVADGMKDRMAAAESFLSAMPCVGVYEEGALLSTAVAEYKLQILECLDQQEASEGVTEWSRKVRRGLTGIDGWFVGAGRIQLLGSKTSETEIPSPTVHSQEGDGIDSIGEDISPTNQGFTTIREPQSPPEEQAVESPGRSEENDGPITYGYRPGGLRKMDWELMDKIEEAAQKSAYIHENMICQMLQGCSPAFEDLMRDEGFTEGFDNYPDLPHSVAWRVLRYCKSKAGFFRPRRLESSAKAADGSTSNLLREQSADLLPNGSTDNHGIILDGSLRQKDRGPRGVSLRLDTGKSDAAPPPIETPIQTPIELIQDSLRPDISFEDKIANFEQALIHHHRDDREERKSTRRRELESNVSWRNTHKENKADFDQLVQEEMARSKFDLKKAQKLVRFRNNRQLEVIWGPEGIRSPTPSPTRRAREQERKEDHEYYIRRFKAELTCNTYRSKWRAWSKLPDERRYRTAEPTRPSSIIAWLEEEDAKMAAQRESQRESAFVTNRPGRSLSQPQHMTRGLDPDSLPQELDEAEITIPNSPPLHPPPPFLPTSSPPPASPPSPPYLPSHLSPPAQRATSVPSSTGSHSSTIRGSADRPYANLDRRAFEHVPRALKALIGMTAMSEAMKRGRLARDDLSREDLVRTAELAISRDVRTLEELAMVPFPRHDPEGGEEGVGEVREVVWLGSGGGGDEEGEEEGWQEEEYKHEEYEQGEDEEVEEEGRQGDDGGQNDDEDWPADPAAGDYRAHTLQYAIGLSSINQLPNLQPSTSPPTAPALPPPPFPYPQTSTMYDLVTLGLEAGRNVQTPETQQEEEEEEEGEETY